MSKPKYLKFQTSLSIGNRKSQIVLPIEIEEDVNYHEKELTILMQVFVDALKAIPTVDDKLTDATIVDLMCEYFNLQRVPLNNETN